jgi:prepilin peptidase CpaA
MNAMSWFALAALVGSAVATDLMHRRIPNSLVVLGLFLGVALATSSAGLQGSIDSLAGAAAGLALLLPFFCLRMVGAGDAKLMAVVGSFAGLPGVLWVALYTGLAGGVLALGARLAARQFPALASTSQLPYAVAIAAGTATWFMTRT